MDGRALDKAQLGPLILGLGIVIALVLIIDVVLALRWLIYHHRLGDLWSASSPDSSHSEAGGDPLPRLDAPAFDPAVETLLGFDLSHADGAAVPTPEIAPSPEPDVDQTPSPSPPEAAPSPSPPFAPVWSLVDPFLGFQAIIALTLAGIVPLVLGAMALHGGSMSLLEANSPFQQFLAVYGIYLQEGVTVAVVAFFLWRYGLRLTDIGLVRPTRRQILTGFGLGVMLLVGASGIENAILHLLPHHTAAFLQRLGKPFQADSMFQTLGTPMKKALFALGGAVAAPIAEEVFFRGFLYNALKRRVRVTAAILLSGLAFAVAHISPLALLVIFPMGIVLAYVYERTRSLWVTIIMHAVNNGAIFALLWFWPNSRF